MIGCYSHGYGAADRFAGYFSGDHVWVAGYEAGEELEDGDLEVGGGVGVDAVVGFDDDEANFCAAIGRGGGGGGGEGGGAQAGGVGGEGCGEAGGVEMGGEGGGLVDYAEVAEVLEHLRLRGGKVGFGVGEAEFEGAEGEEEGEDVNFVHV